MDIWLDTTYIPIIQKAVRLGLLAGVTTNPTLIAESKKTLEEVIESLLHYQEGPITVQAVAMDTKDMVYQGQNLYALSNRIIIKVPITKQGLEAIHLLSRQSIPTMATALFTPAQALTAAKAGATYIAPYLSRLETSGIDPLFMLYQIKKMYHHYKFETKILGASLKNLDQVMKCAEIGIEAVTLKDELFECLIEDHTLTQQSVQQFNQHWMSAGLGTF